VEVVTECTYEGNVATEKGLKKLNVTARAAYQRAEDGSVTVTVSEGPKRGYECVLKPQKRQLW
jgi:hypothetical protein